jgi:hypothetical protein
MTMTPITHTAPQQLRDQQTSDRTWTLFKETDRKAIWQADDNPEVFTTTGVDWQKNQVFTPIGPLMIGRPHTVASIDSAGINYVMKRTHKRPK